MLESIRACYLLDDDLTIAITADATARVFGAQVQPFNQRLVFRLVIRGVSNALSVFLKDCTGGVANDDPDGAWPWVSTTTTIRIEANLPNKFIHGQRIHFQATPKHSSCDDLMDQERLSLGISVNAQQRLDKHTETSSRFTRHAPCLFLASRPIRSAHAIGRHDGVPVLVL
jgi:hypothetical protein